MAHPRPRMLSALLRRRLKMNPVVAIQGARQTGKSFLARQLLETDLQNSKLVSLDSHSDQSFAQSNPQTFLSKYEDYKTLIIDEAQKSPAIFDEIKLSVDNLRRPGRFLLVGSAEFSRLQRIRESLTGRMSRVRLYPMIAGELVNEPKLKNSLNRNFLLKYTEHGGMPGIAFVRDQQARSDLFQDWIDLTCNRDIHQFKTFRIESDIAFSIFKECSTQYEATQASIARALRIDGRRVATHLKALEELFVLTRLDPHPSGGGKSIFLPMDAGLAFYLGASLEKRLHIILLNERMAQNAYFGKKRNRFFYYRSRGKRIIHLVEESLDEGLFVFEIGMDERIKLPQLELLKAFGKKNKGARLNFLAPIGDAWQSAGVTLQSWETILCRGFDMKHRI